MEENRHVDQILSFNNLIVISLQQVLAALASVTACSADADASASPDAEAALVAHHGSPYYLPHQPHHVAFLPTSPFPPHGHSTPNYGHSSPLYSPTTPAYGYSTPAPPYGHSTPSYGYSAPSYGPSIPVYEHHLSSPLHHKPSYGKQSAYSPKSLHYHKPEPPKYCGYEKAPACSDNTTKSWCIEDYEYPEYEIKAALEHHKEAVIPLYADVTDLNTANSVLRPNTLSEETYLCPSETKYVRPLRIVNTEGKWKFIVNNIKVDYETFTQTTRTEECILYGKPCPLVPHCYESSCLQKFVYHRFLTYDPCDKYFPFAIDTFKLPASCSCHLAPFKITH